eukprot:3951238-Prorocentrum_lima.AAC.1
MRMCSPRTSKTVLRQTMLLTGLEMQQVGAWCEYYIIYFEPVHNKPGKLVTSKSCISPQQWTRKTLSKSL